MAIPKAKIRKPALPIVVFLRWLLTAAVVACLAAGSSGCRTPKPEATATYRLGVHRVFSGPNIPPNAMVLDTPNGKTIRVNPAPLLSSMHITRIELADLPGHPGALRLILDSAGRFLWIQARHQHAGELMAVTVDGWFLSIVPLLTDGDRDDCVVLPGPWPEKIAMALCRRAELNYEGVNLKQ